MLKLLIIALLAVTTAVSSCSSKIEPEVPIRVQETKDKKYESYEKAVSSLSHLDAAMGSNVTGTLSKISDNHYVISLSIPEEHESDMKECFEEWAEQLDSMVKDHVDCLEYELNLWQEPRLVANRKNSNSEWTYTEAPSINKFEEYKQALNIINIDSEIRMNVENHSSISDKEMFVVLASFPYNKGEYNGELRDDIQNYMLDIISKIEENVSEKAQTLIYCAYYGRGEQIEWIRSSDKWEVEYDSHIEIKHDYENYYDEDDEKVTRTHAYYDYLAALNLVEKMMESDPIYKALGLSLSLRDNGEKFIITQKFVNVPFDVLSKVDKADFVEAISNIDKAIENIVKNKDGFDRDLKIEYEIADANSNVCISISKSIIFPDEWETESYLESHLHEYN